MNDFSLAAQLVTSPSKAFTELRERPRFVLPLLLICFSTVALICWYYLAVDLEWLKDHMLSANPRMASIPEADRARIMSSMTRNRMLWSGVIAAGIGIVVIMAVQALYLLLAGKITNVQYSYKHWFSLTAWSGIPTLVGAATGAIMLVMQGSNLQADPGSLQMLSLNELFFHRTMGERGYTLLSSANLLSIWCWFLAIVGVQTWSRRSWLFSAVFVLLPYAIVYCLMAWFAFK